MQTDNTVSVPVAADLGGKEHQTVKITSTGIDVASPGDVIIGTLLHSNLPAAFGESVVGRAATVLLKNGNEHFVTLGDDEAVTQGDLLSEGVTAGTLVKRITVTGATIEADDETVTKVAHGLSNGQRVQFSTLTGGAGLSTSTVYYVINKTDDTFELSLTSGGAAVNVTTDYSVATGGTVPVAMAIDSAAATSSDGVIRAIFL